ncbi:MarR family transcriptional regulator [Actinoplanes sp. NBRC 14428]|uniref:DNA-binding MarR family transcriptional regulator n=1 Tax=Pseudosporangium ferrugineum TaxID=439699 RepID=A0A2T0S6K5_9ACTN|nr:MarR family winged helix-turn-helix transcriptional regulator [Pseudosporangium ferrugineum]PRY29046.1 DNA-binding MarR family transcriptional regulator [Pseudosporangium ferrugineum]BCJ53487.1 MarR family transcriptional regulator [Actinoplanes sp. NBRC 14428]
MEPGEEPRWLDPDELQTWLAMAGVLGRLPGVLDSQLQREAGVTTFEYQVLAALSEAPGRTLRLSDLAARADGSLPRLSQVVSRLEKRGWVRRRPDPTDGRYTLGILTDDGWEKVVATAPGHVEAVRRHVLDPLTKAQQRQLRASAQRILRALDPGTVCGAGS